MVMDLAYFVVHLLTNSQTPQNLIESIKDLQKDLADFALHYLKALSSHVPSMIPRHLDGYLKALPSHAPSVVPRCWDC